MYLNTDLSTLLLLSICLLSSNLAFLAWKPPNPPPKSPYQLSNPVLLRRTLDITRLLRFSNITLSIYHCVLLLLYPWHLQLSISPPLPLSLICPNIHFLSPSLFTWSPFTIFCQSTIILAASLRLLCFRSLGLDFSFLLAKLKRLKTDGLYAWVQHPSYVGSILMMLGSAAFLYRIDGVQGCWLPKTVWRQASWLNWGSWGFFAISMIVGSIKRVKVEEQMLKETFGDVWEVWHKKTARFIPGLI